MSVTSINIMPKVVGPKQVRCKALQYDSTMEESEAIEGTHMRMAAFPSEFGYEEQMLDKLHTDLHTDPDHIIYFNTDTLLMFDMTRKQLLDDVGELKLCHRSVAECGEQCEMFMQSHAKLMLGEGKRLDDEFMNLGDTFPHYLYPHLRLTVEEFKGAVWKNVTASTIAGGTPGRWKRAEWSSFTDFNAMGVLMWRDFHDRVHWIDIELSEFDTMIRYNQSWSGKEDEAKRDEVKRRFECFRKFQHNAENFNFKNRDRARTHEAK